MRFSKRSGHVWTGPEASATKSALFSLTIKGKMAESFIALMVNVGK